MLILIAAVVYLIAVVCTLLYKTYDIAPARELKRQAANGNDLASRLYQAVVYGQSLRALLTIGVVVAGTVAFGLIAAELPLLLALPVNVLLSWLLFLYLPKSRIGRFDVTLTRQLTGIVVWLLHYLDTPLRLLARLFRVRSGDKHSGLYELEDLLDLLAVQGGQADSRIPTEQLELIRNVTRFKDQLVRDVMRPRAQTKSVALGDAIGPILLDELHASGQTVFPVKKTARSKEIVASLHLGDVGIHSTGFVQDYATQKVAYLNDADTLQDALHAFYQTKQQLSVVIDDEREYLGVITLEDILHTLAGKPAADEASGPHDDAEAVSGRHSDQTVVE